VQFVEGGDFGSAQRGRCVCRDGSFLHVLVSAFALEAYCLFSVLYLAPFPAVAVHGVPVSSPELFSFGRGNWRITFCFCEAAGQIRCETGPRYGH